MMHRNPRMLLRAAGALLRPTAAVRPAPPPVRRPLFPADGRAFSATTYYYGKDDVRHVDIKEQPGAYEYVIDVPGLRADDLTVKLMPECWLEVMAERCQEEGDARYLRKDRPMGKLEHYFSLPQDADLGRVSAACRDGVLTVTVEKLPPPPVPFKIPRTIEVKS